MCSETVLAQRWVWGVRAGQTLDLAGSAKRINGLPRVIARGRAHLLAISKTGSGARPGHPLMKPESREDFFSPLLGLS